MWCRDSAGSNAVIPAVASALPAPEFHSPLRSAHHHDDRTSAKNKTRMASRCTFKEQNPIRRLADYFLVVSSVRWKEPLLSTLPPLSSRWKEPLLSPLRTLSSRWKEPLLSAV